MTLACLPPELLANPTAVLATNGHDGHPQLTAVWYVVEDDRICISITESTRTAKNLAVDSRCSVLIFHPETPNCCAEESRSGQLDSDSQAKSPTLQPQAHFTLSLSGGVSVFVDEAVASGGSRDLWRRFRRV